MDWRRLEFWVTIAFGIAAGLALAMLSVNTWAPAGSPLRRLASDETVNFLGELGDVSGGLLVIVFILIFGGNVIMTVLLRGIEKLSEMREERKRIRTEAREEGLAEGRAKGRAEGRAAGRAEGRAEGQAEGRAENAREWEDWARKLIDEGKLSPDVELPSDPDE